MSKLAGFPYRPMRPIGKPKNDTPEPTARSAIDRQAVEAVKPDSKKRNVLKKGKPPKA